MSILTKTDLVAEVAARTGSTKAATDRFITALQDVVIEAVAAEKEVKLTGFVAFSSSVRPARTMRNPKTGESIQVAETKVVKIRPLGVFREKVQAS